MERIGLRKDVLDKIRTDTALYCKVAISVNVKPLSLPRLLLNNDIKLTQAETLKVIREHTGIKQDSKLLTEIQD